MDTEQLKEKIKKTLRISSYPVSTEELKDLVCGFNYTTPEQVSLGVQVGNLINVLIHEGDIKQINIICRGDDIYQYGSCKLLVPSFINSVSMRL